jgi:hypothetical protein
LTEDEVEALFVQTVEYREKAELGVFVVGSEWEVRVLA